MKHKWFAILIVVIILVVSSGSVFAQGTTPPTGPENPASLPKSAFLSPGTGTTNRESVTLERDAVYSLVTSPLVNGNFEQGQNIGWMEYSWQGWPVVTPAADLPIPPHSGNWAAWLGGDDSESAYIAQTLTLPASAYLQLYYWAHSTDDCGYDVAQLKIRHVATSYYEVLHQWNLCSSNNNYGWVPLYIDLSAYAGYSVELLIDISTDVGYVSNLFIDDIALSRTFADVSYEYWAEDFIQRMYSAGITGGCAFNPLQYCPETIVNRAQMAVFLERGIHGSSYTPPPVGVGTGFSDVPNDYWAAVWLKQLAADGITGGCGPGTYCPEYPVTRDQMAVFLLKSKYGSSYAPPAVGPAGTGFADVPANHWAAPWIKQLAAEGITSGCGGGNYCPATQVTRAQMAVFLVKNFNLP